MSNELCRVRALHRSLASRNARPNSLRKIVLAIKRKLGGTEGSLLLPRILKIHRSRHTNDDIRPGPLIQARNNKRQTFPLTLRSAQNRPRRFIPQSINQPQRQSRQHPRMCEQWEVRSLSQHYYPMPPHGLDILLVDDRRPLPDYRPVKCHRKQQRLPEPINTENPVSPKYQIKQSNGKPNINPKKGWPKKSRKGVQVWVVCTTSFTSGNENHQLTKAFDVIR